MVAVRIRRGMFQKRPFWHSDFTYVYKRLARFKGMQKLHIGHAGNATCRMGFGEIPAGHDARMRRNATLYK